MATKRLHVVGEDERPSERREMPLELLKRALPGATNDEMLELAYQVLENLGERTESAADFAIDSDNRDVENEALVFIKEADDVLGSFHKGRLRTVEDVMRDAEADLEKAIRNRRQALEGKRTALEQFSYRRQRRAHSAWEVEASRERRQADELLERANITAERVMEAMARAVDHSPSREVRPVEVAVALLPELADPSLAGRQRVVTRVAKLMRGLVVEGRIAQIRPDDYDGRRKNHRYALQEVDDA